MDSPGADPNVESRDGVTALHYAAEQGHEAVVRALLAAGAVPAADKHGHTPEALALPAHPDAPAWFRPPDPRPHTTHV